MTNNKNVSNDIIKIVGSPPPILLANPTSGVWRGVFIALERSYYSTSLRDGGHRHISCRDPSTRLLPACSCELPLHSGLLGTCRVEVVLCDQS